MTVEDRNRWIEEQYIFGYKEPELPDEEVHQGCDLAARYGIGAVVARGGHNGLADVLDRLGSEEIPRLHFGIGRPAEPRDTVDFVLERFVPAEEELLALAVPRAVDAVECFVREGIAAAMNRFNGAWPEPAPEAPG